MLAWRQIKAWNNILQQFLKEGSHLSVLFAVKHSARVHEGKKTKKCSICESTFADNHALNRHISRVHDEVEPEKLFACAICDFRFEKRPDLSKHVFEVHEKKMPFECSMCKKDFKRKVELNRHIEITHEGKRKFECTMCGGKFTSKQGWVCSW